MIFFPARKCRPPSKSQTESDHLVSPNDTPGFAVWSAWPVKLISCLLPEIAPTWLDWRSCQKWKMCNFKSREKLQQQPLAVSEVNDFSLSVIDLFASRSALFCSPGCGLISYPSVPLPRSCAERGCEVGMDQTRHLV